MPLTKNTFDKFVRVRPTSGSLQQRTYPVAAANAINPGDFVSLSSGTLIQTMAANATANGANAAYANTTYIGIALSGCTSAEANAGATVAVAIADDNLEIGLRGWNATGSDGELQDFTVGGNYEIMRWTSNPNTVTWYAAATATTNNAVVLIQKPSDQAAADDYPIMWFRALTARRQGV